MEVVFVIADALTVTKKTLEQQVLERLRDIFRSKLLHVSSVCLCNRSLFALLLR
jgi:hypothetical protein